jgi:hypothetical protein
VNVRRKRHHGAVGGAGAGARVGAPSAAIYAAPRETSAHAAPQATASARASNQRPLELIGHAHAKEVIGDLVDLLEVDEVVDAGGEAVMTADDPELCVEPSAEVRRVLSRISVRRLSKVRRRRRLLGN